MSLVVPKLWCPLILRVLRPRWNDLQLTTKVDPLLNSLTCFWKQVQLFNAHRDFLPLAYHSTLMPHCVMGRDAIILLQKKKKKKKEVEEEESKKRKREKKRREPISNLFYPRYDSICECYDVVHAPCPNWRNSAVESI